MADPIDPLDAFAAELNAPAPAPSGSAPQPHPIDPLDAFAAELNNPQAAPPPPDQPVGASPASAPAPGAGGGAAPESTLGSALSGIGDTATFGFLDEASAALESLGVTAGTQAQSVWSSGKSFGDTYAANLAYERSQAKADADAHPYAYHGGQLGGALLVPFGTGAKGALQVARVGALQGALYGAGSGTTLTDRAGQAAEDAVIGGATASVLHPIINAVGALGSKLLGRGAKALKDELSTGAGAAGEDAAAGVNAAEESQQGLTGEVTDDGTVTPPPGEDPPPPSPVEAAAWTTPDAQGNRSPVMAAEPAPSIPEDSEMVPLHTEGTPEAPAGEPVGSISRAGLNDLQSKVEALRSDVGDTNGRAVDITPESPEHPALGAFRLGNLGDGPETMSLIGALTRQLEGLPKLTDAGYVQQVQAAAKELGAGDYEAVDALAKQLAGPTGRPDLAVGVWRTAVRQAADSVDLFHGAGIDWDTASDQMVKEAGQAVYNIQQLSSGLQQMKVTIGRALRAFQVPNSEAYFQAMAKGESLGVPEGMDPERTVPPLPTTREEMQQWFDLWGMTKKDPELQEGFLTGTLTVPSAGKYLASSFANAFTANVLSAPKTVLLNIVGPTVINTVRALEKMSGAASLALDPTLSTAERAQYAATAKATPLALLHTFGDIGDAFRYGVQAFRENQTVLGGGGTIRDANITFGPYNDALLRAGNTDPDWRYTLGNVINIWPKAFARVNAGLDEMAKRLTYLNEIRVRAMVDASGQGLAGDAFHQYVRDALARSVDEAGAATREDILASAERTTLTGQVGSPGNLARKASGFIQTLRSDYPLTRFILPVFNVPANGLGETLKRVPGINILPGMDTHIADLSGSNGVVAQAEAHGRALLGAAFLTGAYLLNQAGVLTGAGPQNAQDARIWRQTHEPYSVRVGDTWVSYRKLDILGGLLSIPATISDASVYMKQDGADLGNAALGGVAALMTWFKDQASMRSATQLLTLGDEPWANPGHALESLMGQIAGGMVPGSSFLRTVGIENPASPGFDPYQRMKVHWDDYLKAAIPGMSPELEPLRNVLGEPINRPNNSVGEALFPVTLAPVATYTKEPVLDELTRLYRVTGYAAGADPKASLFGYADPKDVKLDDGVSLYSHLLQARANARLDGQSLKEALTDLFNSPEYNEAVDGTSAAMTTSNGDQTRGGMVRDVFGRYDKAIKANLASQSPIALDWLTAAAAKHRDDDRLRTVPIDQLVKNPALYGANGIDPTVYSDKLTDGAADDLLDALRGGSQ